MNYRAFLIGLRLKHFTPAEVLSYANRSRGSVLNDLPPKHLWENIVPTLQLLDLYRAVNGKPITLTSIYRAPDYNRAVGGASQSWHMKNVAIDFQVAGQTPLKTAKDLLALRKAKAFKGGIGLYSTFCHVDTRGRNTNVFGNAKHLLNR